MPTQQPNEISLDPQDWDAFRTTAHTALDEAIDFLRGVKTRPVWNPVPEEVRARLAGPIPVLETPLQVVYREFQGLILPYPTGNIHPRFFGWVHGAGLASGILAEMLAAAMNANCGGRDHGAIYVEEAVIEWCKKIFGFPVNASGLLVSGTSMANLIGICVARNSCGNIRKSGLREYPRSLVAYTSGEAHESVARAMEVLGLGSEALRKIAVREDFAVDVSALRQEIRKDRQAGLEPFCVIGTAGSVNTGAIDPLEELADLCAQERLWFHVDGAFGALGYLAEIVRQRLKGIEKADSLAFDFHKWAQVQYDAGCILVRNRELHRAAFAMQPAYLKRMTRGLGRGENWPCDYGPELSRSFRALKVWFAFKELGTEKIGQIIEQNCEQARYLQKLVSREPALELLAPAALNIVCFRFRQTGFDEKALDDLNANIVADLQEEGIAVPSTTRVRGQLAIRVNITNHRTRLEDLDVLVKAILAKAGERISSHKL